MTPLRACGWILHREGRILLLRNAGRHEWGLPKGHAEPGETELETALRELLEETGLGPSSLEQDPSFRIVEHYSVWTRSGSRRDKECIYFLAHCLVEAVQLSPEHDAHMWATAPDVSRLVPHPFLRQSILKALP